MSEWQEWNNTRIFNLEINAAWQFWMAKYDHNMQ
jgi:hypothetical protein